MPVNTVSLIPELSVLVFNADMKTCDEIRRDNLTLLIKESGGFAQIAEAYGCTEAAIKTMLRAYKDSKSGTPKGIGTVAARKLESCMKKERGWIDQDRSAPRVSLSIEEDLILSSLPFISQDMKESWIEAAKRAIERAEPDKPATTKRGVAVIVQLPVALPIWTNEMLTTVTAQHADWWTRSMSEIARRIALIETDGNILHAFAPKNPPKKARPLTLAYEDRRKQDREIAHGDRRRKSLNPPLSFAKESRSLSGRRLEAKY